MPFGVHHGPTERQVYRSVTPVSLPDFLRHAECSVRAVELAYVYWASMPTFVGTGAKTHSGNTLRGIRDRRQQDVTYCKKR